MGQVELTREESERIHAFLRKVKKHLSRIYHDMNNPLSIISGNVELMKELSRALEFGDDLQAPLEDVAAAVEQLGETADELLVLRNLLQQMDLDMEDE